MYICIGISVNNIGFSFSIGLFRQSKNKYNLFIGSTFLLCEGRRMFLQLPEKYPYFICTTFLNSKTKVLMNCRV